MEIIFKPIGMIHTPFQNSEGTPIQSVYAQGIEGSATLAKPYQEALDDIEGFERLWLIYWMDRTSAFKPKVLPYRDTREHGLFATRSPARPNAIGMSIVRLVRREGAVLYLQDMDMLDGTPLLDVKPYVPEFDAHPGSRAGWFDAAGTDRRVADARFQKNKSG